jgi:hypothetical protein
MKMKTPPTTSMGHIKGHPKRKDYSHECTYLKDRKLSNK